MHNLSHRHRHALRKQVVGGEPVHDYQIVDPTHRPDLRGEFAGAKVRRRDQKQFVSLTPSQAQFYLTQGAIELVSVLEAEAKLKAASETKAKAEKPPPEPSPEPHRRKGLFS